MNHTTPVSRQHDWSESCSCSWASPGSSPASRRTYDGLNFAGDGGDAELLGLFQVSVLHNIVHALFGVGIVMAATPEGARTFLIGSGVIYIVLFLLGIIGGGDWVPINSADNWLHLGLAVGLLALGLGLTRDRDHTVATT